MPRRAIALRAALALLTALMLVSIFPRFNLRFLAPVALTPLLIALALTPRAGQRFVYGFGAGVVYWFFLCTWIQFVLQVHAAMGVWGGWGSFLVFCVLKALHLAVFSLLAGPLLSRWYAIPAVAALWTGLERTHGTFGFAWLALGNAGIDMSVPLRLAPYVGVYGLSFVFCMLSVALALGLLRRPRLHLAPLLALPLLLIFPAIPQNFAADQQAAVVQPNLDPEFDWTPSTLQAEESKLLLLSRVVSAPLVIWPELPAPLYFYSDPVFHRDAEEIAIQHGYFLFGTVTINSQGEPLNSAVILGPQGQEIGHYDQIFLVPFGEFTPPLFSWVNRITHESGDFVPGDRVQVTPIGNHRVGVFICYESAFPHLVRQFSKNGADVFVNISNDGYFGHSEARQQHLLLVRMRAVENRRFIVRATNDGITAVVNPAGRIIKALPPYRQLASPVRYGAVSQITFYAEHGDWFAWSCLAIGVTLAVFRLWQADRESA
jgi:apolipoprotein N-acyltransferase